MSVIKYKKTVVCNCGCNYGGDCGRKIVFLLWYYTGNDYSCLYVDGKKVVDLTDDCIAALVAVLTASEPIEELTDEENKLDPFKGE